MLHCLRECLCDINALAKRVRPPGMEPMNTQACLVLHIVLPCALGTPCVQSMLLLLTFQRSVTRSRRSPMLPLFTTGKPLVHHCIRSCTTAAGERTLWAAVVQLEIGHYGAAAVLLDLGYQVVSTGRKHTNTSECHLSCQWSALSRTVAMRSPEHSRQRTQLSRNWVYCTFLMQLHTSEKTHQSKS